jgi:hypothetical protein
VGSGILWLSAIVLVIGYLVYRTDKKIKQKYQDKFNPQEWELPLSPSEQPIPSASARPATVTEPIPSQLSVGSEPKSLFKVTSYSRQPLWFGADQARIFRLLQEAMGGDYVVLAKIQLADLVTAPAILEGRLQRRVDFVVCSPEDMEPLCLVALESASADMRQLEEICRAVHLPLATLAANRASAAGLRQQLLSAMGVDAPVAGKHKACPLCGADMRQRQVTSGAQAGRTLWVCTSYPRCKGWLALS